MNEQIKQAKVEMLNRLKQYKQSVETQRDVLYQNKYAAKKAVVDEECNKLDNAFQKYKEEKFAVYNADISKKEQEVKDKKQKLIADAMASAQSEVISEISMLTAEYNNEIAKLEKELG